MNGTLFQASCRSLIKPFVIFFAVLLMYFSVIIWMYNPDMIKSLTTFNESMPGMMEFFGMTGDVATLTGFMDTYLYGFLMLLVPLVFIIIAAQRLVVKLVESGAMGGFLASPVSRKKIITTQAVVLVAFIFFLVALSTVAGIAFSESFFKGQLDIPAFLRMNVGVFALHFFIGGICFLASCAFDDAQKALAIGGGLPLIEYLIHMIAGMGGKAEDGKYATFFTLYDSGALREGNGMTGVVILFLVGILLYIGAGAVFCKRDLHL